MPAPILHLGAMVQCSHGGMAMPSAPNARVLVSGQPTVTMAAPYLVAGCPFNVAGGPVPCVTGQWVAAALRVFSNGQPVVLLDSQSVCVPNATPLLLAGAQSRVLAS